MAICGCCGAAECGECDPLFPAPLALKVDLGGPYTCNTGGGNPCAFTMGGLYVMKSPDVHLGFGECHWTYKAQVCAPPGGSIGFLTLHFNFTQTGAPYFAFLDVLANYIGNQERAGYRVELIGAPPRNCTALFSGSGLAMPRISLTHGLCIPFFPDTLSVRA